MNLVLAMGLDNDCFIDPNKALSMYARGEEAGNILRKLDERFLERGIVVGDTGPLVDTDGNTVGEWKVID